MANPEKSFGKPAAGQPCFLTAANWVGEKDLGGNGKNLRVGESGEQCREEARSNTHVVIEKYYHRMACRADTGVRPAPKSVVAVQLQNPHLRKVFPHKIYAAVRA